jgi:predicted RNase H-related nuclease YkuK (DUF458 family)
MKRFKSVDNRVIDVVEHTLEIMKRYPNLKVHIGTDSQNIGLETSYVTVIAYRFGIRGVHYIYTKEKVPLVRDMFTRLFDECVRTLEVAEWFTQQININVEIDMDYNQDEIAPSHKLIGATRGWALSLGYKVNVKPDIQIATKAADYHCR